MSDEPKRKANARRITAVVASLLYIASMLLPAGNVVIRPLFGGNGGPGRPYYGFVAFLLTMFAPLNPSWVTVWFFSVWLANPVFWLGLFWCIRGRAVRAATAGLLSVTLGLSILPLAWELALGRPGYWVWLASFLALFVGSSLRGRRRVLQ
jgi:hypothetical protein